MAVINNENTSGKQQITESEKTEPSIDEKKILNSMSIQVLQQLDEVLKAILSFLRSQLVVYTEKRLKNQLKKKEFISDLDLLGNVKRKANSFSNFVDKLPLEALNGIPMLKNIADDVRKYANRTSHQTRNLDYRLGQMNNKQLLYDAAVQQLDNQIRKIEGHLEYIQNEIQRKT